MTNNTATITASTTTISDLGKALEKLAFGKGTIKTIQVGRVDMFRVSPFDIDVVENFNARDFSTPAMQDAIVEMADSVAELGVVEPVTVRLGMDGRLKMVNGETRLRGVKYAINVLGRYAGIDLGDGSTLTAKTAPSIPVKMEPKGTSEIERLCSQSLLNSNRPFSLLEAATNIKKLVAFGLTPQQIYLNTMMTPAFQARALAASATPEAVQAFMSNGTISPTRVAELAKTSTSEKDLVEKVTKAAAVAKAQGKSKVSSKHIEGGKLSPLKVVKALLAELSGSGDIDSSHKGKHVLTLTDAQFEAFKSLAGKQ